MKKCFCAVCHIEKSSSNPFKLSGENPDFCKQCRGTTASYWAEEPKPSFYSLYPRAVLPKRKKHKTQLSSHTSPKPENAISLKPESKLSPAIESAWKEEAQHRASAAAQMKISQADILKEKKKASKDRRRQERKAAQKLKQISWRELDSKQQTTSQIKTQKQQKEPQKNQQVKPQKESQIQSQKKPKTRLSMSMELGDIATITKVSKIENSKKANSVETNKKQ